jgi:hypothetical protein
MISAKEKNGGKEDRFTVGVGLIFYYYYYYYLALLKF